MDLQKAIEEKNIPRIIELLPTTSDSDKAHILKVAITNNNIEIIKLLLPFLESASPQIKLGTILHLRRSEEETIKFIISNTNKYIKDLILLYEIPLKRKNIIDFLLSSGANSTETDKILIKAIEINDDELIYNLLSRNPKISLDTLKIAIRQQNIGLVEKLLGIIDKIESDDILIEAINIKNEALIKRLLEKNAKISIKTLQAAIGNHNFELANYLISNGIDIKAENLIICSLWLYADIYDIREESYYIKIINFLLEKGLDLKDYELNESRGETTNVEFAAFHRYKNIIQYLFSKGIGTTTSSLITSAKFGYTDIVEILLKNGGNINAMDSDGLTALTVACLNNRYEIVELLLDAGATISDTLIAQVSARPDLTTIRDLLNLARSPKSKDDMTCPICMARPKDTVVTPCGHTFCNECISMINSRPVAEKICPMDRAPFVSIHRFILGGYKSKYLKYKQKYIALKEQKSFVQSK